MFLHKVRLSDGMVIEIMNYFDKSEFVNIRVTKVFAEGEFSHWEVDVDANGPMLGLEGTAPSFFGCTDMASEYIWEMSVDNEWFKDDKNASN